MTVIDDARLIPIRTKVEAGERLTFEDGVTLYRTSDILALGYLANLVRERMHGDATYFNVNRHINPTDVCVASCRLCAFGKRVRDPKAYTMSLDEVWQRAGEGWSEAVTEFHIVGGLHPELTLDWYCEMLRGLKQRFPQVHLKAFTMVEIAYLARRGGISIRQTLEHGFAAGRRGGDLQRARAPHHLRSQDRRQRMDRDRAHGPPVGAAVELHDALRPHRKRRGPRRPPGEVARATGRNARLRHLHPASHESASR